MKLAPIAQNIIMTNLIKLLTESATGDAATVQTQMFALGTELKKDGDDITDDEVQAAMLSALIDANGKVDDIDVSDVDAIKKEIKESKNYINESGILHSIESVGTVLGNAAFMHILVTGLHKVGFKNVEENSLKAKLEKIVKGIKKVTGWPAKMMEKAFSFIAEKLGFSSFGQTIAGLVGSLVCVVVLLALAIYLFPSIASVILIIFAIAGMMGKIGEIKHLYGEIMDAFVDAVEKDKYAKTLKYNPAGSAELQSNPKSAQSSDWRKRNVASGRN